ncbi:MAG TPA: type IV-A pilus assembly ATPase PilB [bacterium]
MALKLGELLRDQGIISPDQLNKALEQQKAQGGRIGYHLVQLGFVTEDQITTLLSRQFGVPSVNLGNYGIDREVIKLIPAEVAKKYLVMPISRVGMTLTVAMADPSNVFAIDDIKFMTGYNIEPVVAAEAGVIDAIKRQYGGGGGVAESGGAKETVDGKDYALSDDEMSSEFAEMEGGDSPVVDVDDFDKLVSGAVDNVEVVEEELDEKGIEDVDAPIVKLVNGILIKAIKMGVSDIHIEPYEKSFRVRYRLDGVLRKAMGLPLKIRNAIISRIKIMSRLDIAERRLPQDGRIKLKLGKKRDMDFRVSVLPTLFGEKVVMRLLDKSNLQLDMTKLGFEQRALDDFQAALHKPFGMILVTGPTGSGKTTTLYSALHQLNQVSENIMTAEDPVEFNLAGINQVQMHDEIGLNFAAALRSFLRQDPDIIMVGEIRDYETAEIGVKAALTGHLVLSTLHTNDAPSTINRLLNMGIEPFLVSSSVILIVAQRLLRRICSGCKAEVEVNPQALIEVGFSPEEAETMKVYHGTGCSICSGTGYKGRVALYEVMTISDRIRDLILQGASTSEIKAAAVEGGMYTLRRSGLEKVKLGATTVEEVIRVTFAD